MGQEINEITIKEQAKNIIDANAKDSVVLRAIILSIMSELNILRDKHGLPERTVLQLKNAIKNRIDTGDAD